MKDKQTMTCADLLIRLLRDTYGVRALFGIPGVHTVELYRGLEGSDVQHITPRHEPVSYTHLTLPTICSV